LQSVKPSEITVLDPESQIPWQETFLVGCGVDALTGQPKASALKEHIVEDGYLSNKGPPKLHTVVHVIRGVHEQSRKDNFEGGGTVNSMNPLALDASFAMQASHFSSNHSFLSEIVMSGEYDFEKLDIENLELTSEALALSRTPEEFRKRYGDYFVLGFKRRYWFHALVECRYYDRGNKPSRPMCPFHRSSGVDDVLTIEASAILTWRYLLDLHGQAELNRGDSKSDLNAPAWVSHSGCRFSTSIGDATEPPAGLWVTCNDVIRMAQSFSTTEQPGWKETALLVPYR
jgi:hypothetical protein